MTRFVLVSAVALAALVVAACGGGGDDATPTPASITPTPEAVPCTAGNLYGALVATDFVGESPLYSIGITNTLTNCTLSGPPTLNWYSEDGARLDVADASTSPCQPQAGDFSTCVFAGEVLLVGGAATPAAGVDGQAIAVIGVEQESACTTTETAKFLGLQFPGIELDTQIELTEAVTVPTCEGSVSLYGYGPLPTPAQE
jgi:hypothetical protein